MSVRLDNVGDCLASNGNTPSLTAHSFFMWCKFISTTAADRTIMCLYESTGGTQNWRIEREASGLFRFRANGGTFVSVASAPTYTTWFAVYFIVNGTSVTCGWRQEGGTSWTTNTGTASSDWTALTDGFRLGDGFASADMEIRYMRQWNAVASEAEMTTEFQNTTIQKATPLRNCALAAGSTAGTSSASPAYNLVATNVGGGNLGDGASEPSVSSLVKKLKLLAHPSAAGASSVAGVVFSAPTGGNITGTTRYGEFTAATFATGTGGDSGYAVLKVAVNDFGGGALSTSDTPVALARNTTYTTGLVSCTVIEE